LKFSPSIKNAISYTWNFGDRDSSTSKQPEPVFTYPDRGTFNVRLTVEDIGGCKVTKIQPVLVDCKVGVQDELASQFNLSAYPNPFSNTASLRFELAQSELVKVSVIDMLGREMKITNLGRLSGGKHDVVLDESYFGSAGSYMVKIQIGDTNVYKQLIKQ